MISVIIPSYNKESLIVRTLRSVEDQNYGGDIEIILVDDCSTDGTLAVTEAIADTRVKILRQEKNSGPSAARNRGLAEATGEYVAFLDADDYWLPDFLKTTAEFLDGHPEAVAVFVGQEHRTLTHQSSVNPPCLASGKCSGEIVVLEDFWRFWREQGSAPLCTGSVLMRRDILRRIGGQREDMRVCEDLEYWCCLGLQGKIGFIPSVLFVSDGVRDANSNLAISRRQRLERYGPRWRNAMSMAQWKSRLDGVTASVANSLDFRRVLGSVAAIMVYCMIQDGRWNTALQEFRTYHRDMPNTSVRRILDKFAYSRLTWYLACSLLFVRERLRG